MSYFILMGRRIPKQAITGFKFQNETDNIRPFLSIRIRGKDEIIPFKDKLEKTDEDMYYNSEWDYTCEESELEPEDKNDPDVHKVYEAGMYYIYSECNECTSKLFVDMIKSICNISEQVKSFINPEQIKAIAGSNEPILLLSNN